VQCSARRTATPNQIQAPAPAVVDAACCGPHALGSRESIKRRDFGPPTCRLHGTIDPSSRQALRDAHVDLLRRVWGRVYPCSMLPRGQAGLVAPLHRALSCVPCLQHVTRHRTTKHQHSTTTCSRILLHTCLSRSPGTVHRRQKVRG
jgi:hypothetical protein